MSETVIVMYILKGYRHINNVLGESVTPLVHCPPFLMSGAKSPLQENTTGHLTAQCLYTRVLLNINKNITEMFLPIGREEPYEIL